MKKATIISNFCYIIILILFELFMYFFVGEDTLLQKGALRTIWIFFPMFIVILSIVTNLIIKKKKR